MGHCVVTGGADGIGRAVAQLFARAGYGVTIVDRDRPRGEATCRELQSHGGGAALIEANLLDADAIAGVLGALGQLAPADVFVHSAGISAVGAFAGSELERQQHVLDLNLRAPLQLTAGLLAGGLLARDATLVFIASLSVFTGYPGAAVYAASKDGVAAYARSLRVALKHRGVNVLTVYPGPTRTEHARRYSPDNRREHRRMPPEKLAELLWNAVGRRQATLIPGMGNRVFAALGRLAPALTEYALRKTLLDKLG